MTRLQPRDFDDDACRPTARSAAERGAAAWKFTVCVTVALAAVVTPTAARGQKIVPHVAKSQPNGVVVQVPSGKVVSRRSGLQVEVDTRWMNNFGYRPIRVRVMSPQPTIADHSITVRLYVASSDWWTGAITVEQDFVMPLGSTSAKTEVTCPQYHSGHRCWWEVWVDGVKDADLSIDMSSAWQFAAPAAPNPNSTMLKFLMLGTPSRSLTTISPGSDLFEVLILMPDDLPERWIDYTSFDVVALTPSALAVMAEMEPLALQAVLRWVRSGGQLWVSDVGLNWERLADVEQLLGMPAADSADAAARGWMPVPLGPRPGRREGRGFVHLPTGQRRLVRDPAVIEQLERDPDYVSEARPQAADTQTGGDDSSASESGGQDSAQRRAGGRRGNQPADSAKWYVEQPFGLGTVRVFRKTFDPAGIAMSWGMLTGIDASPPDSSSPRSTPLEGALRTVRNWESRHGMTPDTANGDFANLLVPGVGQAPVTEFRVLITLFVLAIGPGNYWLLKRTNRLHLLVLTVPLLAAVLTVGLFGYALVSDGIRTLVRVHSYTALDQRTGEAVCWARLSYYAGLAPSHGLVMPSDVAVYPILAGWNESSRRNPLEVVRQMEWRPAAASGQAELHLTQGWLRSRTPTQYLTVRVRNSPRRLNLTRTENDWAATNELGAAIHYVAAIDEQGNFWVGQDLADHATDNLVPATRLEVLQKLRPLVLENAPEMPAGLVDDEDSIIATRRRGYQRRFGLEYSSERLASNLAGDAVSSLVGTGGRPPLDLPPRSYVAITETGPEVAIGVPNAKLEAGFHVLVGRW